MALWKRNYKIKKNVITFLLCNYVFLLSYNLLFRRSFGYVVFYFLFGFLYQSVSWVII